jgi:ArsR family transcriptional regulator
LLEAGLVSRRKEGLQVFYRIGDPMVEELCSLVCRNILRDLEHDVERKGRLLGSLRERREAT